MHGYVAICHAILNYAFLIPENYERVIRASSGVIIDGHAMYPYAKSSSRAFRLEDRLRLRRSSAGLRA